jgi:D-alanyl-D-alanine dipeptidase
MAIVVLLLLLLLPSPALAQRSAMPPAFVYLRDIDPGIRQDMRYAGRDNFTGRALPGYRAAQCILRRPVALALRRVQADLASRNLSLKVYDCYRPTRAVRAMARWAQDASATPDTRRFYPHQKKSQLFALGYISGHSAHSRGVAVDLTLVLRDAPAAQVFNPQARYGSCTAPAIARAPDDSLDMGTGFDCFDIKSATRNPSMTPEQKARRRLLLDAMTGHGFRNYAREWWHFSYRAADTRSEFNFPIEPR